MNGVSVIEGEIFEDRRGRISSLNAFRFPGVERVYFINHPDPSVIRGWHGHRFEKKWFYCVKGEFTLAVVRIDKWDSPGIKLVPEVFTLSDRQSRIVCVPEGYANCLKAEMPDSTMMVFSGKVLEDALADSWRYAPDMWMDWEKKEPRHHA